ncbi:bifunctional N(6)-L-threonylcarbamoyladenine synthase/serine/threonine protein kinase [Halobaculum sp. MBLA0147]|uniref:bifunctional N(6)-L-threonylcarbamoyladenine synthase/serine/threonine protein kinase n=1 Tax=Halobaculum sp. MBLA0147 TaxID=3079934 RepID=UPI003524EA3E
MRVLGIEGTAWMASAAVYDTASDESVEFHDRYEPDSGGIHPREAAEHMGSAVPDVVERALTHARETAPAEEHADADSSAADDDPPVDAVAFSRGPGLGPCLRIVGTAARALAGRLDVPLVGVNHMVAHLEIGRHRSGFDSPVCLNASGANAHLLGYRAGRYRVLGETTDTGVGNSLDKFTRHVGWSHPGGPKVERHAADGSYHDLPYVVKGMDFSFSGIVSAAKDAVDDGVPVENVCHGLQEHVFGMLTEVSERALSLTGADELVLGGGVGQNARLREMLAEMCEQRGADFYAPEPRFLRDNANMIAVLGAKMAAAGQTVPVAESAVDPDFRPDQVPVGWRDDAETVTRVGGLAAATESGANDGTTNSGETRSESDAFAGAEAAVRLDGDTVVKRRVPKTYRHETLDERLRAERTVSEARLLAAARRQGVPTPLVRDVDTATATLELSRVGEYDLARALADEDADGEAATEPRAVASHDAAEIESLVAAVGGHLARLHAAGIVHGDPTTRNVRVAPEGVVDPAPDETPRTFLIDFGLGHYTDHVEDLAVDLHVFERSLRGTVTDAERLVDVVERRYERVAETTETTREVAGDHSVLERLREVEGRGRYQ